uniref:Uncharacterized protein n=1 Tax=Meloidogyne enterolobii TaxID=390850 RepID=A0A6V7WUC6_MELEN|nr:unnamed protein product [Meloidogyne enterolobii]
MTEPVPLSRKLGKKPKWYFADDKLSRLPSKMSMDLIAELKYRREAAEFVQEMAERLNHNIPQHRGQLAKCIASTRRQNCLVAFIWLGDVQILKLKDLSPIDDDDPLDNFLMLLWLTTTCS